MIELLPSDDQQHILDGAQALLCAVAPLERFRSTLTGDPFSDEGWSDLIQFGWFTVGIAQPQGGLGLGVVEEMLLFREAGRFLLPVAVLATSLAAHVAASAADTPLVGAFADGTARAGFAVEQDGAWLLIDCAGTTHVLALGADGICLLEAGAFTDRAPVNALDEHSTLERATLIAPLASTIPDNTALLRRMRILTAAMLVGCADGSLRLAVDHAKVREQFGRPIGAFQAVKHHCANMSVAMETASAQVALAALSESEAAPGAGFHVLSAALAALRAAQNNGAVAIQVHGGMGFTWDAQPHRYLKRTQLLTQLLGGRRHIERALLAERRVHH